MNLFQDIQALIAAVRAGDIKVAIRLAHKLVGQIIDVLDPQIRMNFGAASGSSAMKATADSCEDLTLEECCDELEKACQAHGVSATSSASAAQGPLLTIVLPILWTILKKYFGL